MTYVPDMTEKFADAGEPEEEFEYYITADLPMTIAIRVSEHQDSHIEASIQNIETQ